MSRKGVFCLCQHHREYINDDKNESSVVYNQTHMNNIYTYVCICACLYIYIYREREREREKERKRGRGVTVPDGILIMESFQLMYYLDVFRLTENGHFLEQW